MDIEDFNSLLEDITCHFRNKGNIGITTQDVYDALYILLSDRYAYEWQGDMLDLDISFGEAVGLLSSFDFSILHKPLETDVDLLPKALLIQYKVKVKANGLIWIIHRYDHDPFPSNPHAHLMSDNIKLNLSTGECYRVRAHVYTISKKDLQDIREKATKVHKGELPPLLV